MRSILIGLRVGGRLVRPRGHGEWAAATAVAVAALVATLALVTTFSVLGALERRDDVLQARNPILGDSPGATYLSQAGYDVGDDVATILTLGPRRDVTVLPPGAPAWPRPGEVLLSPSARRAAASNPYLAALVAGHDIGTIGAAGLRDPDEIVAYVGADGPLARARGVLATGFGAPPDPSSNIPQITSAQRIHVGGVMIAVVGAAALVLISTAGSLASAARRRRLAALQLLGAPRGVLTTLAALVTALVASIGAAAGAAVALPLTVTLGRAGLLGVRWWAAASLPPTGILAVVAGGVVTLTALRAARLVDADPWQVRRRAADRPVSAIRLAPLLLGAVLMGGLLRAQRAHPAGEATPSNDVLLLALSTVAVLVGLIAAGPVLVRASTHLMRAGPVAVRLGAARADHHARRAARVSGALVVLLLVIGVAVGVRVGIAGESTGRDGATTTIEIDTDDAGEPPPRFAIVGALRVAMASGGRVAAVSERGRTRRLTRAAQVRPHDSEYDVTVPTAHAVGVAAAVQRRWAAAPGLFTEDLAGRQDALLLAAGVLLALALAVVLLSLAVCMQLVAAQDERAAPDSALLATGMARRQLAAARAAEAVLVTLSGTLPASVLAVAIAEFVMHIDDSSLPDRPSTMLALVALAPLLAALLAILSALAAPSAATLRSRRE